MSPQSIPLGGVTPLAKHHVDILGGPSVKMNVLFLLKDEEESVFLSLVIGIFGMMAPGISIPGLCRKFWIYSFLPHKGHIGKVGSDLTVRLAELVACQAFLFL